MSADRFDEDVFASARIAQLRASDPHGHRTVNAHAGSGKTRVLVDRVIRLLLAGTDPSRILCMTFTKAGASEMKERLFDRLGTWATLDDLALERAVEEVQPSDKKPELPGRLDFERARALFARALETPGGLRINTIHSFCEQLLRRFPLEAGVAPGFVVATDEDARGLFGVVQNQLAGGDHHDQALMNEALEAFGGHYPEFVRECIQQRLKLSTSLRRSGGAVAHLDQLRDELGVTGMSRQSCLEDFVRQTDIGVYQRLAAILREKNCKIQGTDKVHRFADSAPADADAFFTLIRQILLTDQGLPRDYFSPSSKKIGQVITERMGQYFAIPDENGQGGGCEFKRLLDTKNILAALELIERNQTALRFFERFSERYRQEKARRNLVDFDDLMESAERLLRDSAAADWVRYKLDGGITHILVDEAQDSNGVQWNIARAIAEDFVAGAGVEREQTAPHSTIFAVGDEKQAIFGFQGATPKGFEDFRKWVLLRSPQRAVEVKLDVSFRSARSVLRVVDQVFKDRFDGLAHMSARKLDIGSVRILPSLQRNGEGAAPQKEQLALQVVETIESVVAKIMVDDGKGSQRPADYGDIMVLVQSRGGPTPAIIAAMQRAAIPLAGRDRIRLAGEPVLKDIVSFARALLNPLDRLSVAEVLMGPFCHPSHSESPPFGYCDLDQLCRSFRGNLVRAVLNSEDETLIPARHLFSVFEGAAQSLPVLEFFQHVLSARSETKETYQARLIARLGTPCIEAINLLMARALTFEQNGGQGLEIFLDDLMRSDTELRRELHASFGAVRVITVHGAKGLEAPIILLPDLYNADNSKKFISPFYDERDRPIWTAARNTHALSQALKERKANIEASEKQQLFYVALTRPRDHLFVFGDSSASPWYQQVRGAIESLDGTDDPLLGGLVLGNPVDHRAEAAVAPAIKSMPDLPSWLEGRRSACPSRADYMNASEIGLKVHPAAADEESIPSPLDPERFEGQARGSFIHKLLEMLPALKGDQRLAYAQRLARERAVDPIHAERLFEEVLSVLEDETMAHFFGPDSRAEVPIVGQLHDWPGAPRIHGRIDRLVISQGVIRLADFKTDRPPPERVEAVSGKYLAQLAAYRDLLRPLYPNASIECVLIWTWGPKVMGVPDGLLDTMRELTLS
jgi:ATP-dependent helicase/nuclease subunit A